MADEMQVDSTLQGQPGSDRSGLGPQSQDDQLHRAERMPQGVQGVQAVGQQNSPPQSPSQPARQTPKSARSLSRHNSQSLSLDLSDLPPLVTPSPPSNTLLITNLMEKSIFHPASLATIRESIARTAPLYSFSPLKSFRRIIVTFYDIDAAFAVRQQLDGEVILGHQVRVYFGAPVAVDAEDKVRHLAAPQSDKLFFISPPPSPPHGWEMRNEEPPNKDVHADDLAHALAQLHAKASVPENGAAGGVSGAEGSRHEGVGVNELQQDQEQTFMASPVSPSAPAFSTTTAGSAVVDQRKRSGSTTLVYHPEHHGDSPTLPAVMVEDTTGDPDGEPEDSEQALGEGEGEKKIMAHTARPPVELMEH